MSLCLCISLLFVLLVCSCMFYFFFFKQKTAYEMRISDWSSDVCSSDLRQKQRKHAARQRQRNCRVDRNRLTHAAQCQKQDAEDGGEDDRDHQIGRASCRERVCQYV